MTAPDLRTLSDLVFHLAEAQKGRQHLVSWQHGGERRWLSTEEWVAKTHALALALEERGVGKADRVAIFSENRPEWHISEFACQLLGAISVPLYPTLPADQVGYATHQDSPRPTKSQRDA